MMHSALPLVVAAHTLPFWLHATRLSKTTQIPPEVENLLHCGPGALTHEGQVIPLLLDDRLNRVVLLIQRGLEDMLWVVVAASSEDALHIKAVDCFDGCVKCLLVLNEVAGHVVPDSFNVNFIASSNGVRWGPPGVVNVNLQGPMHST